MLWVIRNRFAGTRGIVKEKVEKKMNEDAEFLEEFGNFSQFLVKDVEDNYLPKRESLQSTKLPVKVNGKIIAPKPELEHISIENSIKDDSMINNDIKLQELDNNAKKQASTESMTIYQVKEELAMVAITITQDPESHITKIRELFKFCVDSRPAVVKLAILTLLSIFKDIIPGYRIRKLSEQELGVETTKQVRKLRAYEQTLLSLYQQHLQKLEHLIKRPELFKVIILSMAEFLSSHLHFNFRRNLMLVLADTICRKQEADVQKMCLDSIVSVFKNDEEGEATFELVKILSTRLQKSKYAVPIIAIEPFLCLNFNISNVTHKQKKVHDKTKGHVSKKRAKEIKHLKQVEKEFQEAEAVFDKDRKANLQKETLKFVFNTYFRILKTCPKSILIPTVLLGLEKHVHLINVEYFDDLLVVLKNISKEHQLEYLNGRDTATGNVALNCISAVFKLMDSVGDAIAVDLNDFYSILYAEIMRVGTRAGDEAEMNMLCECIAYLLKKNRHVPIERIAAFVKRLATLALVSDTGRSMVCLEIINNSLEVLIFYYRSFLNCKHF